MTDRRSFIGGSDAAAAVGLDPGKSPLMLWMEKTGQVEAPDISSVWRVRRGRALEPEVLGEFINRNGAELTAAQVGLTDARYPWAGGTADAIAKINGSEVLVEVKTAAGDRASLWGDAGDAIPMRYLMQVHHYMTLAGLRVAYVPVLIGEEDYREYRIEADPELASMMMRKEGEFWRMVQDGTPPDAQQTEADQRLRWAVDKGQSIEADSEAVKMHGDLMDVRFRIKELEDREGMLKALLMQKMGEASALMHGGKPLVTWKTQTANRLDQKALKDAHPELVSQFTRESSSRTFLPKKI